MTHNKVAVVTGSGKRRVGAAVAEALAQRGYDLVLHYQTSAAAAQENVARLEQRGTRALAVQADLTEEPAAKHLFDVTLGQFGRIDVLVTCAAIWQPQPLEDVTAADLRRYFDANTLSTFLCCQLAGLAMVGQADGGCIVTLGDWAIRRPYLNYAAYFASKGAIPTLTRCLAVELGTRNPRVRVNCVLPGPVLLPPDISAAEREAIIRATLVKRTGRAENVAQAVLYLVDNDFVTGDCLTVDGGRSIFAADPHD